MKHCSIAVVEEPTPRHHLYRFQLPPEGSDVRCQYEVLYDVQKTPMRWEAMGIPCGDTRYYLRAWEVENLTLRVLQRHWDHECIFPSPDPEPEISVLYSSCLGTQASSKLHHEKLGLHGISMQACAGQLLRHGPGCQIEIVKSSAGFRDARKIRLVRFNGRTNCVLACLGLPATCASVMMRQQPKFHAKPNSGTHFLGIPQHVVFCLDGTPCRQCVIGHD